jgi:hypothetical protein
VTKSSLEAPQEPTDLAFEPKKEQVIRRVNPQEAQRKQVRKEVADAIEKSK